jgi:hypothetical protein
MKDRMFPNTGEHFQPPCNLLSDRLIRFKMSFPMFDDDHNYIGRKFDWIHEREMETIVYNQMIYEQSPEYKSMVGFFDSIEHLKQ